ncbi:hypothetical protein HaLaN_15189 [Haematococcus lacustris]|uniref:Uncharacterized protein n=1 Tax=Haematococcus lacustris TaxID=44745 RepID=A0A699Z895_HAELA|nr:hypothetical protein HaLaN_15189 [Haematococcus lacustris]
MAMGLEDARRATAAACSAAASCRACTFSQVVVADIRTSPRALLVTLLTIGLNHPALSLHAAVQAERGRQCAYGCFRAQVHTLAALAPLGRRSKPCSARSASSSAFLRLLIRSVLLMTAKMKRMRLLTRSSSSSAALSRALRRSS